MLRHERVDKTLDCWSNAECRRLAERVLFITLNREDFSFVIHLDRQPRTSRRREAQTGSRARSGSRSERTLDAVEHSRTLMEWWPFLIFHRGGLRIKVINNKREAPALSNRFQTYRVVRALFAPELPGASGDRDPVLSSSPHPTGCDEPRDFRIFSIIDRHAALQLLEPFDDELSMGVTVVYPDPTFPMTYVDGEQLRESASLGVVFLSCEDAVTQAPSSKL